MAIIGSTDLGGGLLALTVDHDPTTVATLAPAGSMIIDSSGNIYWKKDGGSTTNVQIWGPRPKQEIFVISQTDVTNGYVTLSQNPFNAQNVQVWIAGGSIQTNKQCVGSTGATPDFDVLNTNRVHINNNGGASGLSGVIKKSAVIIVIYNY